MLRCCKICGITRLEDAMVAAQVGADAIGLVFYPGSPRHITIEQAKPIAELLAGHIQLVALTVNASVAYIKQLIAVLPIDILQFHGDESPQFCRQFALPYWKAIAVDSRESLLQANVLYSDAQALLLDTPNQCLPGGTGQVFDWQLIPKLHKAIVLAGGLTVANVAEAIAQVNPWGVDVSSGVEASKGIKDHAKIKQFITQVRNANI